MNKNFVVNLLILSFVIILCACDDDNRDDKHYNDMSKFVVSSNTKDSISIQIGSNSCRILQYDVFPQNDAFQPLFRCPTIALTNKGTTLVACDNRTINNDTGEIEILLARKERQMDTWRISKVFPYDSNKGRSMSPMFLVDILSGRVYLFVVHFNNNNRQGRYHMSDEMDYVYKYSDDDGVTWSDEYSLKDYWTTSNVSSPVFSLFYNQDNKDGIIWSSSSDAIGNISDTFYVSSCVKGLMMDNGIMLVPSIKNSDGLSNSILLINEKGEWRFSQPTPNIGDNECTVYLDTLGKIVLDCRTYENSRHKYYYDLESDSFMEISPSVTGSNVAVSAEIINDRGLFYMCFPDSQISARENLTFYGSKDGINWVKIFRILNGDMGLFGYSCIAVDQEQLLACYETQEGIYVLDISAYRDYIRDMIVNK